MNILTRLLKWTPIILNTEQLRMDLIIQETAIKELYLLTAHLLAAYAVLYVFHGCAVITDAFVAVKL